MAGQQPNTFTNIEALHATTQLYTQRRRSDLPPNERKFTVADMAAFLETEYGWIAIQGAYTDDSAAADDGVTVGQVYELTADNIYGLPAGTLKKRTA
jgi:S1-C subfamily serine protease